MAAAAISAGSSLLGGLLGGKGASKAAKIQAAAYQKGIDEQARQFDTTQQNFAPFLAGGQQGLDAYLTLLGLNGNGMQGDAIASLKASPQFTLQYDTGVDTILQNASATGGLRGGNTQNSLATFGSQLLNQIIQQQLGNYGGLISTGTGSASSLGQLGQSSANAISDLLAKQGSANGTAAAAPYAAAQGALSQLGSMFGSGGSGAKALGW